jgi:hypothetical protein
VAPDASDATDEPIALVDGAADVIAPPTACELANKTGDPLGCTYLAFAPWFGDGPSFGCVALFVSNPGLTAATLKVTWKGASLDLTKHARLVLQQGLPLAYVPLNGGVVPPGATAIVALVQGNESPFVPELTCPFPAALGNTAAVDLEKRGTAFRIEGSEPLYASAVLPFGMGLQTAVDTGVSFRAESSWDVRYRDVGTYKPGRPERYDGGIHLDASGDAEATDFWWSFPSRPVYTAFASTRPIALRVRRDAGVVNYKLGANEVLVLAQDDQFIGSVVEADDILTVGTGSTFLRVPYDAPYYPGTQNSFHWMSAPSAWGSEVAAVRFPRRYETVDEAGVWRIVAAAGGTTLTYDPAVPPGAPTALAEGEQAVFESTGPFVVRSQDAAHPFHVSLLMKTVTAVCPRDEYDCEEDQRGNVELAGVLPPAEYARHFAFLAEPSHAETWLVATRRKDGGVFHDVTLDCAGTIGNWKPIGSEGLYEYAYVALSRGNFAPQTYAGGTCTLGPHRVDSDGPVTLTLWGWGSIATGIDREGSGSYALNVYGLGPRPQRPDLPQK